MTKLQAILTFIFAFSIIAFGTWELFQGNLEAAFSTFPFLLIVYLFVRPRRD